MAGDRFIGAAVGMFITEFERLLANGTVIGHFCQVSTDKGDELELGFFTAEKIGDISLSDDRIFSSSCPLTAISDVSLKDHGAKVTLVISADKKFNYDVVKPASTAGLESYAAALRSSIGSVPPG